MREQSRVAVVPGEKNMNIRRNLPWALLALACNAAAQSTPGPFGPAVPSPALESLRGGASNTFNDMQLTGTTASNTANNVQTGTNSISAGSFANLNGIPIVVQNTGANVLIQNAVILNLQMN
jgi:hypothetical protein